MKYRELGNSGLKVSAIGLGLMGMSEFYGAHDDEEAKAVEISLTPLDLRLSDEAIPPNSTAGERYPEAAMRAVNL